MPHGPTPPMKPDQIGKPHNIPAIRGPSKKKKPNAFALLCRAFFLGILPLGLGYSAAFILYVNSTPYPAGTIFWLMGQLMMLMSTPTPQVILDERALCRPGACFRVLGLGFWV
jgi:hypothetical protein